MAMLDEQIALNFIGHEKELALFEQWLAHNDGTILFFHDATDDPQKKGGVGKTWLLKKCLMTTQRKSPESVVVMVDFFSISDRDGVEIADRLVRQLQHALPFWQPAQFLRSLSEYRAAVHELSNVSELEATLYEALIRDLAQLNHYLEQHQQPILIFFDTFELVENHPVTAVLGVGQTFPDTYHFSHLRFVIAGRNAPDWQHTNWQGREKEIRTIPVAPFSLQEVVQFLNENCTVLDEPLTVSAPFIQEIYTRTTGRPILVGLVTDVLNHRLLSLSTLAEVKISNFERYLVSQINSLENPINWVILFIAHIYHRFTADMLHWLFTHSLDVQNLIQELDPHTLFQQLFGLSFVRGLESGEYVTLHDEMRRLVTMYNWPEQEMQTGLYRRDLSLGVVGYYEYENQKLTTSELMYQTNIVELLYHQTYVDLQKGFELFEGEFQHAIDLWQHSFARSLIQEIRKFQASFSSKQEFILMLDEATLLAREEQYPEALVLLLQLEALLRQKGENWLPLKKQATLLYEKGRCYQQTSLFEEAVKAFTQCLDVEMQLGNDDRVAFIHSQLGNIARRQGELQQATHYYEESVALYKKHHNRRGYANTLHSMSLLSRLQGRFEESLRQCSTALRIRQQLYAKNLTAEVAVGFSLDGIGSTYFKLGDLILAEKYFQEAYEIYARNKHRSGLASIYNRFGQLAMSKNDPDAAMEWHRKAHQEALGVNAEAEINSLNKQGRVYLERKQFEEAIRYFRQSIQRAIQVRDFYQQAETLIDLATVYERLEDYEKSREALREAEEISNTFHYHYLLGLAFNLRGDNRYKEGEYTLAFEHYEKYCYYMALFNQAEYERAVRKTTSHLLEVPDSQQQVLLLLQQLESHWNGRQFPETSSLLPEALAEVRLLLDV